MLTDLILITLLLGSGLYWFNGQQAKEAALQAVRVKCLNLEVQMLDEYVALSRIRLNRGSAGKIQLQRAFLFEFSSTGNDRYNGICIMLGRRVESIQMELYRIEES
jgi:hypothetical protein